MKQIESLTKDKLDLQNVIQDRDGEIKKRDLRIQQLVHNNKEKQVEVDKINAQLLQVEKTKNHLAKKATNIDSKYEEAKGSKTKFDNELKQAKTDLN